MSSKKWGYFENFLFFFEKFRNEAIFTLSSVGIGDINMIIISIIIYNII
jgi:hypothetical protein